MNTIDLVCFSHVRWDFVYQRPQHLMTRLAGHFRVIFIEEPVLSAGPPRYESTSLSENLTRVVPYLPAELTDEEAAMAQKEILQKVFHDLDIHRYFFWYCTPMALPVTNQFDPQLIVYDCMDELSA